MFTSITNSLASMSRDHLAETACALNVPNKLPVSMLQFMEHEHILNPPSLSQLPSCGVSLCFMWQTNIWGFDKLLVKDNMHSL